MVHSPMASPHAVLLLGSPTSRQAKDPQPNTSIFNCATRLEIRILSCIHSTTLMPSIFVLVVLGMRHTMVAWNSLLECDI